MVSYLQLAHSERHPVSGSPVAKVIHNFGRADQLDREALRRLVASISRFLEPAEAVGAGCGLEEVEVVDARRSGGAYVLDALFARLGIAVSAVKQSCRSAYDETYRTSGRVPFSSSSAITSFAHLEHAVLQPERGPVDRDHLGVVQEAIEDRGARPPRETQADT